MGCVPSCPLRLCCVPSRPRHPRVPSRPRHPGCAVSPLAQISPLAQTEFAMAMFAVFDGIDLDKQKGRKAKPTNFGSTRVANPVITFRCSSFRTRSNTAEGASEAREPSQRSPCGHRPAKALKYEYLSHPRTNLRTKKKKTTKNNRTEFYSQKSTFASIHALISSNKHLYP